MPTRPTSALLLFALCFLPINEHRLSVYHVLVAADTLVILKEPGALKHRLDQIVEILERNSTGHSGYGPIPGSISEASDFIGHSTHLMNPLRHAIEYRRYFVFSDVMPKVDRTFVLTGVLRESTGDLFMSGFAVRKGDRIIRRFDMRDTTVR